MFSKLKYNEDDIKNDIKNDNDFVNLDDISKDLIRCYQIQCTDNKIATPIYIGSYKDIPLTIHTSIVYDQNKDMLNFNKKKIEPDSNPNSRNTNSINSKKAKKKNIYKIHIVTYIMPEESIQNDIYKMVGLIIQKNKDQTSLASLDLRYNTLNNKFEYIYCDHSKDTVELVEILSEFPGQDNVLPHLMDKIFEDPIKSIILS
jgi:hypothetical protein